MLIPKGGNAYTASVYMNFAYDPNIAARDRGLRQLHLPGARARQGALKTDPGVAKNPLIFPTKERPPQVHAFDPNALFNAEVEERSGSACWRPMPTRDIPPPAPRLSPYLLLVAGAGMAGRVLRRAARVPGPPVARVGDDRVRRRVHLGLAQLRRRDHDLSRQLVRSSSTRGRDRAALLLSYPLAYWIAFRGGRWKNLYLLFIIAPSSSPT